MDGGLAVTFVSVAMFVGCFLLGFTPLLFRLSERSLQLVCILGAGLLCGTALAIVIPEGVSLLGESYGAASSSSSAAAATPSAQSAGPAPAPGTPARVVIGLALTSGFTLMFVVDQISTYFSTRGGKGVNLTATLGLVIHAAADGFALGAAVATGQATVQVIIFLAVILHKDSCITRTDSKGRKCGSASRWFSDLIRSWTGPSVPRRAQVCRARGLGAPSRPPSGGRSHPSTGEEQLSSPIAKAYKYRSLMHLQPSFRCKDRVRPDTGPHPCSLGRSGGD